MAKKADLMEKAAEMGVEVPEKATVAQIEALIADAGAEKGPEATAMTVRCDGFTGLNVREEPSADANVVGTLPVGEKVSVEAVEDGWARLECGFVKAEFLV